MLEMMNMVCYQVIGCDTTISNAVHAGQLEVNVMMPVVSFNINFMIEILGNALKQVKERCVDGIEAVPERCRTYAEGSIGIATALSPYIGYCLAAEIAIEDVDQEKTLTEVIKERKLLTEEQIRKILDPAKMTEPGISGEG